MEREITITVQDMDALDARETYQPFNAYVHEGAVLIIRGTNDKAIGWVDMHEAFKGKVYRHHWVEPPSRQPEAKP